MTDPIKYRSQNGTKVWVTPDGYIQSINLDWYEEGGCMDCLVMDSARIDIYGRGTRCHRTVFSWMCQRCGHHEIEIEEVP